MLPFLIRSANIHDFLKQKLFFALSIRKKLNKKIVFSNIFFCKSIIIIYKQMIFRNKENNHMKIVPKDKFVTGLSASR